MLALFALLLAAPVRAQPNQDGPAVRAAARFLADQGDARLHAGDPERALALYQMAESLYHAPTLVLVIAETETQLDKLVAAREHLLAVRAEQLAADAPPPFREAQARAGSALAALEPRVPRLTVHVRGGAGSVEVRVDGAAIPAETLGQSLRLDPGPHTVTAFDAHDVRSRRVSLAEGEHDQLVLDLGSRRPVTSTRHGGIDLAWPLVALGVGAAGITIGAVAGVRALDEADQLKASCQAGTQQCDPAARPHEEAAYDWATASSMSFVFGGSAFAAGSALLVLRAAAPGGQRPAALRWWLGPGGAGLRGRF